MIAQERLYLTQDRTRIVREGDPQAAFLLAIPGDLVDDELAAASGITARPDTKASMQAKAVEAAPENKALEMPVAKAKRARLVKK